MGMTESEKLTVDKMAKQVKELEQQIAIEQSRALCYKELLYGHRSLGEEFNRLNEENEALKSAWNEIKEAHGDPVKFYDECKRLKTENERLNKLNIDLLGIRDYTEQFWKAKLSTEQEKVRVLKEAVEFYASYESWCEWRFPKPGEDAFYSRIVASDAENNVGGKRAREALKKIEETGK
jgi:hypothetical protein